MWFWFMEGWMAPAGPGNYKGAVLWLEVNLGPTSTAFSPQNVSHRMTVTYDRQAAGHVYTL